MGCNDNAATSEMTEVDYQKQCIYEVKDRDWEPKDPEPRSLASLPANLRFKYRGDQVSERRRKKMMMIMIMIMMMKMSVIMVSR